jgi:regulator of RNase E activity RraA
VGAVTNGAARDIPALEKLAFPVFAGSICVSHAYIHILEFGQPVQIAALAIQSGNLLHGDVHGVQTIPLNLCGRIPEVAAKIAANESRIIAMCHAPDFSVQRLREAIQESTG